MIHDHATSASLTNDSVERRPNLVAHAPKEQALGLPRTFLRRPGGCQVLDEPLHLILQALTELPRGKQAADQQAEEEEEADNNHRG